MVKDVPEIKDADDALEKVCGSKELKALVEEKWGEINEKKRLDISDRKMGDDQVSKFLKGLHMCASATSVNSEGPHPARVDSAHAPPPACLRMGP